MATADDIAALRRAIDEPVNAEPYTDAYLSGLLDASGTVDHAASTVWTNKAAATASLVDVSESGSSRKLSDLNRNALAMAEFYGKRTTTASSGGSYTWEIERP